MAQSQLYSKRAQIFVSEEQTLDTYEVQTAGEVFLAQDVSWSVESTNWTPQYLRGDFLMGDEVPGSAAATLTFSVPVKGSGDPGDVALEYGEALKMCGMLVADGAGVSTVVSPTSTFTGAGDYPGPSYSATALIDGIRVGVKGGFGNMTFAGNVDAPGIMTFTMQGGYVAVADDALETPTYQTTVAPAFRGAAVVLNVGGAYAEKGIENVSFDLGNTITVGKDVQDTHGTYGARITGHHVTGSFDPELQVVAGGGTAFDPFGDWRAGTTGWFTTGVVGSTAGNKYQITMPRVVLRPPVISDRGGIQAVEIPFAAASAATDVEDTTFDLNITYT